MNNAVNNFRIVSLEQDELSDRLANQLNGKWQCLSTADLGRWRSSLNSHFGSVGLLDFKSDMSMDSKSSRIRLAQELTAINLNQNLMLAVTDAEMSQFSKELLIFGFASVFSSQVESPALALTLRRHIETVNWPKYPFKDQVTANLPWQNQAPQSLSKTQSSKTQR